MRIQSRVGQYDTDGSPFLSNVGKPGYKQFHSCMLSFRKNNMTYSDTLIYHENIFWPSIITQIHAWLCICSPQHINGGLLFLAFALALHYRPELCGDRICQSKPTGCKIFCYHRCNILKHKTDDYIFDNIHPIGSMEKEKGDDKAVTVCIL